MTDTVKFDPGMGDLVIDINEYINDIYSDLLNLHSPNQKRIKFKLYADKIYMYMKNNIAFYLGCLLWAYYLYNANIKEPKTIEGNYFVNLTKEQLAQYDYTMQVNFLDNYFDSYERDTAYYIGRKTQIPDSWKNILSAYTAFLRLNTGFTKMKTTADIVLPDKIKNLKLNLSDVKSLIDNAIENQDLNVLLDLENIDI